MSKELSTEQDAILTIALRQADKFTEDEKRLQKAINVEWMPDNELSACGWLFISMIAAIVISPFVIIIVAAINFLIG